MKYKSIVDFFRPYYQESVLTDESARLIETFVISSLTAIFTMICFSLITIIEGSFTTSILNITASILLIINLLSFKKIKDYFLACHILFFIATMLLFSHQVIAIEPYPHNYFWGCLIPVFAAILAGKRSSLIWTILVALLFSASYLISLNSDPHIYSLVIAKEAYPVHFLAGLNLSIIGGFVIASFVIREVDEKRKKIDKAYYRNQILLNIVTHDVSNPLSVLQNTLSLFDDNQLDERGKKHFERMRRSVQYLGDVLRNVRQTNAIHSGKFEVEIKPVNLNEVFERVFFLFDEKITQKELKIVKHKSEQDIMVYADQIALGQSVINNIISNAIKFSHRGGTIDISIVRESNFVVLSIKDYGVGMKPLQLERIFLPYTSTTRKGTDNEDGTGFGMPIVKALVERFGGEVDIESVENVGTTIILKLKAV